MDTLTAEIWGLFLDNQSVSIVLFPDFAIPNVKTPSDRFGLGDQL